jgi:hypothetical protein
MKPIPTKLTLAAAHVGEAIRLLLSVDRTRFQDITRQLQPFVRQIEQLRKNESNQ